MTIVKMPTMLDITLSERDFQAMVLELAEYLHYGNTHHEYDSRFSSSGYPDLSLLRADPPRFIMSELKTEKGIVKPKQIEWLTRLDRAGIEVYVWRPSDWDDIVRILSAPERDLNDKLIFTRRARPSRRKLHL